MTAPLAAADTGTLLSRRYWQQLAPTLTLSDTLDLSAHTARGALDANLRARIERDGAHVVTRCIPSERAERMLDGIDSIRMQFGHEVFALLYDEFWITVAAQVKNLETLMGTGLRAVPLPLVNYVPDGDAGFKPHRDRFDTPLAADGSPNMVTVWFALTDAGTDRGCLAVLPSGLDPNFPDALRVLQVKDIRDVRALPVAQGDAVVFNQAVMHFGTRNSSGARRVSFAIEIERADAPEPREPHLHLCGTLTFQERLAFLGHVVLGLADNNVRFSDMDLRRAQTMAETMPSTCPGRLRFGGENA